jgi:hypothetical protein
VGPVIIVRKRTQRYASNSLRVNMFIKDSNKRRDGGKKRKKRKAGKSENRQKKNKKMNAKV